MLFTPSTISLRISKASLVSLLFAGLAACSGNSSSTSQIEEAYIEPLKIDSALTGKVTTGTEADWNATQDWVGLTDDQLRLKASHAYRTIYNNTILATLYREGDNSANLLGGFSIFINLFKVNSPESDCFVSGTKEGTVDSGGAQQTLFIECQDGNNGQPRYFDGVFAVIEKAGSLPNGETDVSKWTDESKVLELSSKGQRVISNTDAQGVVTTETIDINRFLFQSKDYSFYFSGDYVLDETYDVRADRFDVGNLNLDCATDDTFENNQATRTHSIVKNKSVTSKPGEILAAYQQGPDFNYVELQDFALTANNYIYSCEEVTLKDGTKKDLPTYDETNIQFAVSTKLASKEMGYKRTDTTTADGTTSAFESVTTLNWTGLRIPTFIANSAHKVEGEITIVHTNSDGTPITLKVVFDDEGKLEVEDGSGNTLGSELTINQFLKLSETPVATP